MNVANLIRQSTSSVVLLGPFVDDVDASPETGLTVAASDVQLSKQGTSGASAKTEATACTHVHAGVYECPLDTTDTATLGRLTAIVKMTGAMVVKNDFWVVPATLYDALAAGAGANGGLPTVDANNRVAGIQGTLANTLDALLNFVVEDQPSTKLKEAIAFILAFAAGQTSGMDTSTGVIKSPNGTENRIVGTLDGSGNRTAITLTAPS